MMLISIACTAHADTVYLRDGSHIKGVVQTMSDELLTVETDFAGTLELKRSKVAGVTTEESVPVALEDNDPVPQRLAYDADRGVQKRVVADLDDTRETYVETLPIEQVAAIRPAKIIEDERLAQEKLYTLPEYWSSDQLDHPEWSGDIKFGTFGSSGSTKSTRLTTSVSALRSTGNQRFRLQASVDQATSEGKETKADYYGKVAYEHDFSDQQYGFIEQDLERDRFQNYALRAQTLVGSGYFLARKRRLIFKVYAGLGYQYTRYHASGRTGNELITTLGWHYAQLLGKYVKLTNDFVI